MRDITDCHDCGVSPGEPHENGCDVARCTECGWQRISCDHSGSEQGWGQVWSGTWPGVVECREFGLWSRWTDHGWRVCSADHPEATEGLNALARMAARGEVKWNGERWVKL